MSIDNNDNSGWSKTKKAGLIGGFIAAIIIAAFAITSIIPLVPIGNGNGNGDDNQTGVGNETNVDDNSSTIDFDEPIFPPVEENNTTSIENGDNDSVVINGTIIENGNDTDAPSTIDFDAPLFPPTEEERINDTIISIEPDNITAVEDNQTVIIVDDDENIGDGIIAIE